MGRGPQPRLVAARPAARTAACTAWSRTSTASTGAPALWELDARPRGLRVDRRQRRGRKHVLVPAAWRAGRRRRGAGGRLHHELQRHAADLPPRPAARRALERDPRHRRRGLRRLRRGHLARDGRGGPVARPAVLGAGDCRRWPRCGWSRRAVVPDRSRAAAQVVPGTVSEEQATRPPARTARPGGPAAAPCGGRRTSSRSTATAAGRRAAPPAAGPPAAPGAPAARPSPRVRARPRPAAARRTRRVRSATPLGRAACGRLRGGRVRGPDPHAPAPPQAVRPRRSDHERSPRRHPAQAADLVDVAHLVTAYYTGSRTRATPTSGSPSARRATAGSSLRTAFNEDPHPRHHAGDLRLPQARRATTGRCSSAATRTGCPSRPGRPRSRCSSPTTCTVLVDDRDGYTPTPAVSHAILRANRGKASAGPASPTASW